jgi:ubiquinone/menaquinone biosynthesis C-methylase UbiE
VSRALAGVPMLDREGVGRKAELERTHWWYRGRRRVLEAVLARLSVSRDAEVLDIGCGTGATLELLGRYGRVSGVDVNPLAVAWARGRGVGEVSEASVDQLPYDDRRFSLVTCLDVLEHVPDDGAALAEATRVTRPGGLLLISAPAHPLLYSGHDVSAGHARRYTRRGLVSLAESSGWSTVFTTYFNILLLPIAAARRMLTRSTSAPRSDLLATPAALNAPLYGVLRAEAYLIGTGVGLPAGLSILLVLRRVEA